MTRSQLGPNGEKQRVTVERDFKSENELNKFLKEFEENLNKSATRPTKTQSYSRTFKNMNLNNKSNMTSTEDLSKSPG